MMSATLSSVASKLKGRLQVVKIDTDKYPGIASQHRVQVGWGHRWHGGARVG